MVKLSSILIIFGADNSKTISDETKTIQHTHNCNSLNRLYGYIFSLHLILWKSVKNSREVSMLIKKLFYHPTCRTIKVKTSPLLDTVAEKKFLQCDFTTKDNFIKYDVYGGIIK